MLAAAGWQVAWYHRGRMIARTGPLVRRPVRWSFAMAPRSTERRLRCLSSHVAAAEGGSHYPTAEKLPNPLPPESTAEYRAMTQATKRDLDLQTAAFSRTVSPDAAAERALTLLTARRGRSWPHLALHAVHPGWADTPGVRSALPAFRRVMRPFLRDADQGADSIVWLALDDAAAASRRGVWFDRAPHPIDVLPATRLATPQIDALDRRIATLVGPWLSSRGLAA